MFILDQIEQQPMITCPPIHRFSTCKHKACGLIGADAFGSYGVTGMAQLSPPVKGPSQSEKLIAKARSSKLNFNRKKMKSMTCGDIKRQCFAVLAALTFPTRADAEVLELEIIKCENLDLLSSAADYSM
jgi:hypothetical protein